MIVITAATGRYGRLVIESLLRRGVPASQIVAAVRTPEKAADLAAKGVQVREADYDRPDTLGPAFAGAEKLLLIPSATPGQRFVQMERVVKAAFAAGVGHVAYAGFVNSDTSTLKLGDEHKQTEACIRASGMPYILLRNGAYIEIYAGDLGNIGYALMTGHLLGAAGKGKISGASRADLADAAAVVLQEGKAGNAIYELGGTPFTLDDLAAAVSQLTCKPLDYVDMSQAKYAEALTMGGVPAPMADIIADASHAVRTGDWFTESKDLERLLGRPSTPLIEVVEATLKRNGLL